MGLEEKDFIHEEYGKNPIPLWSWLAIVIFLSLTLYGASLLYYTTLAKQYDSSPFLQVTNREISLFLWQNPQYMRQHVKNKNGYLPAFEYAEKIGLNPEFAEDYVIAPPELLFLFHTWKRLLGDYEYSREIPANEFSEFLTIVPEWTPRFWKNAPNSYISVVNKLSSMGSTNLAKEGNDSLPLVVRQAFIGWKNYYYEGHEINDLAIKQQSLREFLKIYPHFNRNFWCNIWGETYLESFNRPLQGDVPTSELSGVIRAAFFNFSHSGN